MRFPPNVPSNDEINTADVAKHCQEAEVVLF